MPAAPRDRIQYFFRACADPVRLRLAHALRDGEHCVCDLMEIVALPQATVSRHLSYLQRAGLVSGRRAGAWNYYRLAAASSSVHRLLLRCIEACADDLPELRDDRTRAARVRRRKRVC